MIEVITKLFSNDNSFRDKVYTTIWKLFLVGVIVNFYMNKNGYIYNNLEITFTRVIQFLLSKQFLIVVYYFIISWIAIFYILDNIIYFLLKYFEKLGKRKISWYETIVTNIYTNNTIFFGINFVKNQKNAENIAYFSKNLETVIQSYNVTLTVTFSTVFTYMFIEYPLKNDFPYLFISMVIINILLLVLHCILIYYFAMNTTLLELRNKLVNGENENKILNPSPPTPPN